jgi:hypothetical protein
MVCGIAVEFSPYGGANNTTRAVTADYKASFDPLGLCLVLRFGPLKGDYHPRRRVIIAVCRELNGSDAPSIIWLQFRS